MPYHLIQQESYDHRTVPCGPDCGPSCIAQRPLEHREDYATATCGREVVRYRDQYCNAGFAKPRWDYDWCRECIMMLQWTPEEEATFHQKGLLTEGLTELAGIAIAAALRKLGPRGRRTAWERLLDRARAGAEELQEPTVRKWMGQVLRHTCPDGPEPGYWPRDIGRQLLEWAQTGRRGGPLMKLNEAMLREMKKQRPGCHREVALEAVAQAMRITDLEDFTREMDRFNRDREEKLRFIERTYRDDSRELTVLRTPAAPAVFMALERDPFMLWDAWARRLPPDLLQQMADIWGVPSPDTR